ncbi:hypothetical protein FRB90_011037 [Tulasnella sp. 427]|nr:hypothetical protein FRB90_011037 [Tulasnella sp. 427]
MGAGLGSKPFSFTLEVRSLDGTIPIVAHGPHEPMVREGFASDAYTCGYPQYVRRDEIYGDRPSVVEYDGFKVICVLTFPASLMPGPLALQAGPLQRSVSISQPV